MSWLKSMLLKVFRGVLETIVQEALEKAVSEINEEIDLRVEDADQRSALKSWIVILRQRAVLMVRERL